MKKNPIAEYGGSLAEIMATTLKQRKEIMKEKTTTKKKNPQDSTLRNIRALKKRVSKLEVLIAKMKKEI